MDELEIKRTFSGFSGVWDRVSGRTGEEPAAARPAPKPDMKHMIREELENAAALRQLARRSCGCHGAVLLEMAAEARQRSCRLRGEYFLRKGEDYRPPCRPEPIDDCRETMRDVMQRQLRLAEQYEAAAAEAHCALRKVLELMAAQNRAGAKALRDMILGSFCG